MFVRYNQTFVGSGTQDFVLDYGIEDATSWSDDLFIIYNKDELQNTFSTITGYVENNHPKLHFDTAPIGLFNVIYGVRSQYELDYGFQKVDKSYSDSIRLIYNNDDIENKPIIDELSTAISTADVNSPSLYIGLDNSSQETTFKLFDLPLLYAPEVNLTFILDPLMVDQIKTYENDDINTLEIKFYYAISGGYGSYYFDSKEIQLNHTAMTSQLELDGSYKIQYSKDLQSIYDYIGTSSMDIYVSISQTGNNSNYISYVILDKFEYICDEHLIEMYDRMPLDYYGNMDISAVINTPHYVQLFSKPFVGGLYGDSPFNLLDNSEITVGLEDLPNSTLVSLDFFNNIYSINDLGSSETLAVNDDNMYMIPNLGLYTGAYNLEEPLYQDGYVNLYYGSGTDVNGEEFFDKSISMAYKTGALENYRSYIEEGVPTSWEDNFSLTTQFLTTSEIIVSGEVLYHQLFDLTNDIIDSNELAEIFGTISGANFGVKIPDEISLSEIREIGTPYSYDLSIHGFPVGEYVDGTYCNVITSGSGNDFDTRTSDKIMDSNIYYSLEFASNGSQYIIFYETIANVSNFAENNKIMVDYWADHYFLEGFDYNIIENPLNPYESLIDWDYMIESLTSYTMHPDFAIDNTFSVIFSALDWSEINDNYIHDGTDEFTFQPEIQSNITVYYESGDTMTFSILGSVSDNQFNRVDLFTALYVYIWKDDNESTIEIYRLEDPIGNNYISQDAGIDYHFIINFNTIANDLPAGYAVLTESFVFPEVEFDSTLLYYPLSHTPFNFKYVSTEYASHHIKITIGGDTVIYSNDTLEFNKYVEKIEDNFIYFKSANFTEEGYIANNTEIKIEYKYKLQPGWLESKHFLITVYPWTNLFDTIVDDSLITHSEKFRKLSGSSIISPFEYSLSINDTYLLLLSYRLNQREYYEEKFTIDYSADILEFDFMSYGLDDYISVFEDSTGLGLNVYYYDEFDKQQFLDEAHYYVYLPQHTITIIRDGNPLATPNDISEFYVSFTPAPNDKQFKAYQYQYDPTIDNMEDSLNVDYWEVINGETLDVIPNLDAYHFIDESISSFNNYICHATQIAAFLEDGQSLSFNIGGELTWFDQSLINGIRDGDYVDLYINTMIEDYDSLERIKIELFNSTDIIPELTQTITIDELVMWNFNMKINLPTDSGNDLQRIEFTPIFRQDGEYSGDNIIGQPQFEFLEWDDQMTSTDSEGNVVMIYELENTLFTEDSPLELAYLFNSKLQYLALPEGVSFNWSLGEDIFGEDIYELHIPNIYINPDSSAENCTYENGDIIVLRYNSPVEKTVAIAIEEMYFNKKPIGFDSLPLFAECLLVNSSDSSTYEEFLTPYNFNTSLQLTPFDTELTKSYKNIAIEVNLSTLQSFAIDGYIDFSHIIFSVPYPSYELTIDQIVIIEQSQELSDFSNYFDNRVWQYTEVEILTSGDDPLLDQYQLSLEKEPLFYNDPDQSKWLEHLIVYDENNTYYSVGISGDEYQLHWSPATHNITWNPSFDVFQEFWGIEEELTPMIAPNSQLYFEYCTEESWTSPISVEYENIDYSSLEVVYNYDYLLTPRYDDWYGNLIENSDYDYELVQYYSESFTIYNDINDYVYTFDTEYDFEQDFCNLSLYKIVGLYANFTEVFIEDDDVNFDVDFDISTKQVSITDLNEFLNKFDLITVILNFTYGPISTSSQIILSQYFNSSFLADMEETFYDSLSISFEHSIKSAIYLFDERSDTITTEETSFASIDYTRNTDLSNNNELVGFGDTTLFEDFIIYSDPFNVIYEADIDMDGKRDYKHVIDVDQNGKEDIIRFGVESEEDSEIVIWHTIIQDFEGEEQFYHSQEGEKQRTEWFDIRDDIFADYNFQLDDLITLIFGGFANPFYIASFFLPDMDYWAQKSVQQSQFTYGKTETTYYSVLTDNDRDGNADVQMAYEKSKTVVYNRIEYTETSIIAAKPQNSWDFLCEYVEDSWDALWGNAREEDRVFNSELTEERLDNHDIDTLYEPEITSALTASYRKFSKITTKTLTEEEISEQITLTEWEDGLLVETRIYRDEFDSRYFDSNDVITITDLSTGQEKELPLGYSPSFLNNSREGWAFDLVSEKFDQLYIINSERDVEIINLHQKTITITIPNRFSPYHDHRTTSQTSAIQETSFTVTGVFITPPDGKVFYTSDRDAFKSGDAKTLGHYFYFDGDLDNFYECVYILAPDDDNDGVYNVIAIGYNYDNKHSFAPYEKINVDEPVERRNDYTQHISKETSQYGDKWVYNFAKLENVETLFPEDTYDGYEVKDHIFEIWKLVDESDKNTKFSQLFYEVRHKEYEKSWNQYSEHFWSDVGDQVFSTLVASGVSSLIMASTLGIATPLAHIAYFIIYATISKFQMDIKAKEAEAQQRSDTFYPEGADRTEPSSLNQKYATDEFWGDSMPAALSGHSGAYYTTVMGGEVGSQYTAQAIVSPPNDARFWDAGNTAGVLDYLGHNVGTFGAGDPDKLIGLDFDNHNLDFLMVSNELYAYNDEENYAYVEDPALVEVLFEANPTIEQAISMKLFESQDYYRYRQNTLGYLTKEIRDASDGDLAYIKPTCIDGQPQYMFTHSEDIVPNSALYQPLVVSPERYEELEQEGLVDGYIVVDVQSPNALYSKGVNSKVLSNAERISYSAKIPLADVFGGFGYPIKSVEMFAFIDDEVVGSHLFTPSEFDDSLGNLYFTKSPEEILPMYGNIGYKLDPLNPMYLKEHYYKVVIRVAKVVSDDGSAETMRSALTQTTAYAVMDYFDQFTFAQTTAQMIAEIGYTEIMTITSTLISAPFVILGSYAAKATNEASKAVTQNAVKIALGAEASKLTFREAFKQSLSALVMKGLVYEMAKRVVVGTIKETIEEIVVDGFFETAIQSAVRMNGGTADAGHWFSTLFTSVRETANFGFLTGGTDSDAQSQTGFRAQVYRAMDLNAKFQSVVAEKMAKSDMTSSKFIADNEKFLTELMGENDVLESSRTDAKITWAQAIGAGLFTGLSLLVPSLAGFNVYALGRIFGSLGGKFEAKLNNKFLASRNSKMLGNDAQEIEKQDTPQKSKTIDPSNLPNAPSIPTMPEGFNPLMARNPIELEFGGRGAVSSGFVMLGDPNRDSNQPNKRDPLKEQRDAEKSQKVKDHLAKTKELENTEENKDGNIVEQQEELKQRIFDNIDFGFDPYDSNLKYPLTDRDNLQSILFKTLLNLIYKNKKTIESVYDNDNQDFGLTFRESDGTFTRPVGGPTVSISAPNLGVILGGLSKGTINKLLGILDSPNQDFTFDRSHSLTIRRFRDSIKQIFDHIQLKNVKLVAISLIDNYIGLRYTGGEYFVTKLLTYIDDYTDFGILSEHDISLDKFKMSNTYLQRFRLKTNDYEEISKYFNLIVNIHLSGESNLGFTDSDKFLDFKQKIAQLTYMTLVRNGIIRESRLGGLKFYSICLALHALTKLRYQNPTNAQQYIHSRNRYGYYTLAELSVSISPKGYESLLTDQLRDGAPSFQLGNIFDELQVGIDKNIEECSIAKGTINRYLNIEQISNTRIGKLIHPLYEQVVIEYLKSKGVKCAHEKYVAYPRRFKPDNIIERSDEFRAKIEAFQDIISIPSSINLISVDYTFASNLQIILDKFNKHYQSEDRLLIIVLLGQKNDRDIRNINKELQKAVKRDDGSKHLENIRIMTSEEYKTFLGFGGNYEMTFDRYQEYSFNIFHSMKKFNEVKRQSSLASTYLESLSEDWIETYLHQG